MNVYMVASRNEIEDLSTRLQAHGIAMTPMPRSHLYDNGEDYCKDLLEVTKLDALEEMPLYIGHKKPLIRIIAEWRLEIGK